MSDAATVSGDDGLARCGAVRPASCQADAQRLAHVAQCSASYCSDGKATAPCAQAASVNERFDRSRSATAKWRPFNPHPPGSRRICTCAVDPYRNASAVQNVFSVGVAGDADLGRCACLPALRHCEPAIAARGLRQSMLARLAGRDRPGRPQRLADEAADGVSVKHGLAIWLP